jgi:alkanesulfonate monooxygenase SsuD/methylene tetrahydromethanopterin reductase-like flavin-dependent oxidoreductase (luciferase family)
MREACLAAETQGYDLFTITDHFYPRSSSAGYPLECWTILVGLASLTERIKLGPLVSCVGYRNPALLGKMAATVYIVSNGRLILGIGAGWHEAEFKAYFGSFPTAKERDDALEETAQILRSILRWLMVPRQSSKVDASQPGLEALLRLAWG